MVLPLENIEKGLVLAKNIADKIGFFAKPIIICIAEKARQPA